ncbi:MAG TPA: hypothetical protein VGF76_03130 [Polyangiaceae bacterium]
MTEHTDSTCARRAVGRRARLGFVLLLATAFQFGCNGAGGPGANSANGGITKRDTKVTHEPCDTSSPGAEKIDANGDGKPDITIVREGGREVCRAVDLNFDGVIDSYSYFDSAGQLRRRENDYDKDGQIDEITTFKGGQIAEKDQSTALARHLDTWDFYQAGTLVRSERDSNGDGVIDQWWEYPKPGCPLIHADVNNDGRPDPGATIDYCKETGYVPPERASDKQPTSPSFNTKTSMPTETENKEVPTETSAPATDKPATDKPAPATSTKGSTK